MNENLKKIYSAFEIQLNRVNRIVKFDVEFLRIVVDQLEDQKADLIGAGIENPNIHPNTPIKLLGDLMRSGPKQSKYQPVYNQCLVLQVSHFASAISALFNEALNFYLKDAESLSSSVRKMEFKFTLVELIELEYDLSNEIGRIIARKSDVCFQDMQSIARAFSNFFSVEIEKSHVVENIIAAQALRHVIVHSGEVIDEKCIKQLASAKNGKGCCAVWLLRLPDCFFGRSVPFRGEYERFLCLLFQISVVDTGLDFGGLQQSADRDGARCWKKIV